LKKPKDVSTDEPRQPLLQQSLTLVASMNEWKRRELHLIPKSLRVKGVGVERKPVGGELKGLRTVLVWTVERDRVRYCRRSMIRGQITLFRPMGKVLVMLLHRIERI
jgi:hypothetical protein